MYLNDPDEFSLEDLLQKVTFVPPKKLVSALMKEMQREKMHMAIVTDQYGGTIGIVTLEDLIEEIIGDVWDENDEVETEFTKLDDQHYLANGDMNIGDLFAEFELDEPEGIDVNTVGGWVQYVLDRMPEVGDEFMHETLTVTVKQIDNKRVTQVAILWQPASEDDE